MQKAILTLPHTVDDACEKILSRSPNKEKTERLLHIIFAAVRPLDGQELNIALAIEDDHRSLEDLDLENQLRFEKSVRNLCGLFVNIVDQRVYLIHDTAKEFLTATDQVSAQGWKCSLQPAKSQLTIARTCMTFLMFPVFEQPGSSDHRSDITRALKNEYFTYSACFWPTHFHRVQGIASSKMLELAIAMCDVSSHHFKSGLTDTVVWFHHGQGLYAFQTTLRLIRS